MASGATWCWRRSIASTSWATGSPKATTRFARALAKSARGSSAPLPWAAWPTGGAWSSAWPRTSRSTGAPRPSFAIASLAIAKLGRGAPVLRDVRGHADDQAPPVGQAAQGSGAELPRADFARARANLVVAFGDPVAQLVEAIDLRQHHVAPLAIGELRPCRGCGQLFGRVPRDLAPGATDLEHLPILGVEQDRERRVDHGPPEPLLA